MNAVPVVRCSRRWWGVPLFLVLLASPNVARAGAAGPIVPCDICGIPELVDVARNIFDFLILVGGAAAVLAVVIAGVRYVIAVLQGASSQEISSAKAGLGYAIFGVILLLTAYVIVNTVFLALGGTGKPPGLQ